MKKLRLVYRLSYFDEFENFEVERGSPTFSHLHRATKPNIKIIIDTFFHCTTSVIGFMQHYLASSVRLSGLKMTWNWRMSRCSITSRAWHFRIRSISTIISICRLWRYIFPYPSAEFDIFDSRNIARNIKDKVWWPESTSEHILQWLLSLVTAFSTEYPLLPITTFSSDCFLQ